MLQFLDDKRQKARELKLQDTARKVDAISSQPPVKPQKQVGGPAPVARRAPAAKRRQLEERQDVSDFASEYALLRKLKRGKLSEVCLRHSLCLLIGSNSLRRLPISLSSSCI